MAQKWSAGLHELELELELQQMLRGQRSRRHRCQWRVQRRLTWCPRLQARALGHSLLAPSPRVTRAGRKVAQNWRAGLHELEELLQQQVLQRIVGLRRRLPLRLRRPQQQALHQARRDQTRLADGWRVQVWCRRRKVEGANIRWPCLPEHQRRGHKSPGPSRSTIRLRWRAAD